MLIKYLHSLQYIYFLLFRLLTCLRKEFFPIIQKRSSVNKTSVQVMGRFLVFLHCQ